MPGLNAIAMADQLIGYDEFETVVAGPGGGGRRRGWWRRG